MVSMSPSFLSSRSLDEIVFELTFTVFWISLKFRSCFLSAVRISIPAGRRIVSHASISLLFSLIVLPVYSLSWGLFKFKVL